MSTKTTPELDEDTRTAAIVVLLAEAITTHERNALSRLALRAEFLWRCHPCKEDHYLTSETCTCGAKRPTAITQEKS